jgi:hypothetical protein
MKKRSLAVGDIHGMRAELERLLDKLNYDPTADQLVFLGDLVDRGPEPVQVVALVKRLVNAAPPGMVKLILGNHEEKMLRFLAREKRFRETGEVNKMQRPKSDRLAEWTAIPPENIEWLAKLPYWERIEAANGEKWIALHGGLEPSIPIEKQKSDKICRVRFIDKVSGKHKGQGDDFSKAPEGAVEWMTTWQGPEHICCGHAVHSRKDPRVDRPVPGVEVWSIDTGGCFGGRLTALVLETREIFQVQAEKSYGKLLVQLSDESEPTV